MMAGNPNWWSMHPPAAPSSLISPQYVLGSSSSSASSSSIPVCSSTENQDPPQSWSQLLFTGLPGEEERLGFSHFLQVQPKNKLENWDNEQFLDLSSRSVPSSIIIDDVIKQEVPQSGNNSLYGISHGHGHEHQELFHHQASAGSSSWSSHHMAPPVSSPRSCVTSSLSSNNNNILDFTYNRPDQRKHHLPADQTSSECNSSTSTGGVCKKARVQPSSTQPHLQVRKEKLGDRITALHQLVSPFGKTDTASVLLEAIGYIRFLQGQIEALSSPYLDTASKNRRNQHPVTVQVHGERNSVFPEDPGQLLNDNGLKRKGAPNQQDVEEKPKDLKSRGLCLVPVSCTQHVGSENGADYWAPAFGNGF